MQKQVWAMAAACLALSAASPALAGDEVLEGKAPAWVEEADIGKLDLKNGPSDLIEDSQHRLDGGVVTSYYDRAIRIDNSQSLMAQNTISFNWLPDKGDLTVHRLQILRDGKAIDLLATGAKFDVIRREQGLEIAPA